MTPPAADVSRVALASHEADALDTCLAALGGVTVLDDGPHEVVTVYYDTPDLRLTREGARLRRRRSTGGGSVGADAGAASSAGPGAEPGDGWWLRLPGLERSGGDARPSGGGNGHRPGPAAGAEETEPLGPDGEPPPARLATLARALVRGAPLVPVATVRSRSRTWRLLGPDGVARAEVRVDDTDGEGPFGPAGSRRTLTIQGPDDGDLRAELAERLAALGAAPAAPGDSPAAGGTPPDTTEAVLAGALGPAADREPDVPRPPVSLRLDRPAADLVAADLRAHVRALLQWEAPVQLDRYDAVHKMRVSVRRLRSSLRTFGPLLDPATVERLEPELAWLAASLGRPRDAEVLRDRLTEAARSVPDPLRRGNVEVELARALEENHQAARAALLDDLETARYRQLLVDVVALAAHPPLLPEARSPIGDVVAPLLRKAWRKLRRRVEQAEAAGEAGLDEGLHRARKAAKQLRYAAEACIPAFGVHAKELAAQAEATQEVLGEHQDSIVSQELLVDLAAAAARRGRDTFTYGVLAAEERHRAERSRDAFGAVWKKTSRKRHRRWLRR